jgi:DNA-binding response OmpR family regulator
VRILVADDDPVVRRLLESTLKGFGHEVVAVVDGTAAWEQFTERLFDVVISDWVMPGHDGPALCRLIRGIADHPFAYVVLLTAKDTKTDLIQGIMAGADEFMTKPFDRGVLQARLHAAERVVRLERDLAQRVADLRRALDEVKVLRGLLPICMYCKRIREGPDLWERIEAYISEHSEAEFTHSICPSCYEEQVRPMLADFADKQKKGL